MAVKFVKYVNLTNRPQVGGGYFSEIVRLSSADFSGTVYCYLEVVATNSGSLDAVELYRDDNTSMSSPSKVTSTDEVNVGGSTSTPTRFRGTSVISLSSTQIYCQLYCSSANVTVYSARLVIIQSDATQIDKTVTHFEIGQYEGNAELAGDSTWYPITYPKYFYYNSDDWSGTISAYMYVTLYHTQTKSDITYAVQYSTDLSTWGSYYIIANSIQNNGGATFYRQVFTPVSGRYYRLIRYTTNYKYSDHFVYNAGIEIIQTDLTNGITKTVSPLHLINQYEETTGANNEEYKGRYDPSEWNDSQGATGLTAKTNVSSPSGGGSGSIYNASGQLSNSLASGAYHATASTAITLPVSAGDIWAYVES